MIQIIPESADGLADNAKYSHNLGAIVYAGTVHSSLIRKVKPRGYGMLASQKNLARFNRLPSKQQLRLSIMHLSTFTTLSCTSPQRDTKEN